MAGGHSTARSSVEQELKNNPTAAYPVRIRQTSRARCTDIDRQEAKNVPESNAALRESRWLNYDPWIKCFVQK